MIKNVTSRKTSFRELISGIVKSSTDNGLGLTHQENAQLIICRICQLFIIFVNSLSIFCALFVDCLSISCQLVVNYLSFLCQLFVNYLSCLSIINLNVQTDFNFEFSTVLFGHGWIRLFSRISFISGVD